MRSDRSAQGRLALALFLSTTMGLALYSAVSGFSDALSFVRGSKEVIEPLPGGLGSYAQLIPAGMSYGFYAPQVCSEFRVKMRLGNSKTGEVREVSTNLGSEASLLVASLSTATQEVGMAKEIASSFASYGFTRDRGTDSAEVQLEVEKMPPLRDAKTGRLEWVKIATFYYKR